MRDESSLTPRPRFFQPKSAAWGHISPYGAFELDLEQRLDLDVLTAA